MPSIKFYDRPSLILTVLFVVTLDLVLQVRGFSSGAPVYTCESMMPKHGVAASKIVPPHIIRLSSRTYSQNQNISGKIIFEL